VNTNYQIPMTVEPLHLQVGALGTGGQLCIRSGRRVLTGREPTHTRSRIPHTEWLNTQNSLSLVEIMAHCVVNCSHLLPCHSFTRHIRGHVLNNAERVAYISRRILSQHSLLSFIQCSVIIEQPGSLNTLRTHQSSPAQHRKGRHFACIF
jgi:hypothetical protein